jgi:hypothetical protein
MQRRRWDTDEQGSGVASGESFAPNVAELAEAMRDPGWVTEDPELHLLPHLQAFCSGPGSPFQLVSSRSEDAVFVVELRWLGQDAGPGAVRAAAFALLGSIAEVSTHVRQRKHGDVTVFEAAAGTLGSDSAFAPHGHLIRLRVRHDGR